MNLVRELANRPNQVLGITFEKFYTEITKQKHYMDDSFASNFTGSAIHRLARNIQSSIYRRYARCFNLHYCFASARGGQIHDEDKSGD